MTFPQVLVYVLFPVVGYLLGSIPFALLLGKMHGVDIRTTGSRNIGATNLGRTLGGKFFWRAFLLDAAKGFFPVLLVTLLARHGYVITSELGPAMKPMPSESLFGPHALHPVFGIMQVFHSFPAWAPLLTAIACVLGHNFPIWLKFKGGKGVATSFGVVLGFWPLYTLAAVGGGLIFVFVLLVYRYISLASIVGVVGFVGFVIVLGQYPKFPTYMAPNQLWPLILVAALFAGLIIFRHLGNIGRLLKGTEPQVGQREQDKARFK